MWRKNRRPPPTGSTCFGVDTNRNWPAYWNRGGSSTNPCSETYMGVSAGSEREVNNVVTFFRSLQNVRIATDWHAYGFLKNFMLYLFATDLYRLKKKKAILPLSLGMEYPVCTWPPFVFPYLYFKAGTQFGSINRNYAEYGKQSCCCDKRSRW